MNDYPAEEDLQLIADWDQNDWPGLMSFVSETWIRPYGFFESGGASVDKFFDDKDGVLWTCATGGWSGNEEIIGALARNVVFWACCWIVSLRGGYYEFRVGPL